VRLLLLYILFRAYDWHGLRTPPPNLDQASISPHTDRGPVYDEAYLNELKASTPSSRPRLPEGDTHHDGTPMHSVLGDSAMEILDTIGNGNRLHIPFFRILLCTDVPVISLIDTGVAAIPSQSAVLAAKEKRERMRAAGPSSSHADEYISLSLTTRVDEYQGPHPESRLMREDDDLGEGDDGELSNQPYSR
jgi:GC-rich sequence DNA-binding factor